MRALLLAAALVAPAASAFAADAPPPPDASASTQDALAERLRAADAAWASRGEPERLAEAIDGERAVLAARPDDRATALRLARAFAFRAQLQPNTAAASWRECARLAEPVLRARAPRFASAVDGGGDPVAALGAVGQEGAEPLYLLALATMGMARARGTVAILSVREEARAFMERAAALDAAIDGGGPYRALGAWLASLPSAAGGGVAASRKAFLAADRVAPGDLRTRVTEAGTLAVLLQDRPRFEALLRGVIAAADEASDPLAPEKAIARRDARALLERADRLF
jgi:hypothetical protein